MYALEATIDRLRTARLVVRALGLLKDLGPYAAIELLLPGGSLIALGLWLYSRHKSGKPLLPFRLTARGLRATMRRMAGLDLLQRRLGTRDEGFDVRVAGMALSCCASGGEGTL